MYSKRFQNGFKTVSKRFQNGFNYCFETVFLSKYSGSKNQYFILFENFYFIQNIHMNQPDLFSNVQDNTHFCDLNQTILDI